MTDKKKVIDYWDDYDPNDYDPTKRPTLIMQDQTISSDNKPNLVNKNNSVDDFQTYSYYNEKFKMQQNNIFDNNDNYDELDTDEYQSLKSVEINQSTELTDLDELNLNNKNRLVSYNDNETRLDINQLYDRWQQSKTNLITRKLDVLRNRVQEPRIEGRRKYSFYAPESLEELLNKPTQVVLDATPYVGDNEYYSDQKYFNNPALLSKVQGREDNSSLDHITTEQALNLEQETNFQTEAITDILKNVKINISASKKAAIFIDDNNILDPDHLTSEQRLRLLKLAADPNNAERKQLLQMKLNNGSLLSLSAIVKERLQKIQNGEIELVEEKKTKDNSIS